MIPDGIEVKDLCWHPRNEPARRVIHRLTFSVPAGRIAALTGPNGSGKSTLLRLLVTLLPPRSGRARVLGHDLVDDARRVRECTGFLPEEPGLPETLSPLWHIRFHGLLRGMSWRSATRNARAILEILGLDPRLPPGTSSKGTRRRIALCRALVHAPPVLLLDEPDAGLDSGSSAAILSLLRHRAGEGCTILIATHRNEWIDRCDMVFELPHTGAPARAEDSPGARRR